MDNQTFIDLLPLGIAICIGLFATLLVFRNASKIGSGTLGKVYRYFATGMLLVLLGFVADLCVGLGFFQFLDHTTGIFFITGFAVMGVGANKILDAAGMK